MSTLTSLIGGGGGVKPLAPIILRDSASWSPDYNMNALVYVIGGGGSGGYRYTSTSTYRATGGGAGGTAVSDLTLSSGVIYTATVGAGGAPVNTDVVDGTIAGNAGSASSFSGAGITTMTANGGGGGNAGTTTLVGGSGGTASGGTVANFTGGSGGDYTSGGIFGTAGGSVSLLKNVTTIANGQVTTVDDIPPFFPIESFVEPSLNRNLDGSVTSNRSVAIILLEAGTNDYRFTLPIRPLEAGWLTYQNNTTAVMTHRNSGAFAGGTGMNSPAFPPSAGGLGAGGGGGSGNSLSGYYSGGGGDGVIIIIPYAEV